MSTKKNISLILKFSMRYVFAEKSLAIESIKKLNSSSLREYGKI